MHEKGIYIYGITDAPQASVQAVLSTVRGLNDDALRSVRQGNIMAFVSSTPVVNFDRCSREELHQYAVRHGQVLTSLAESMEIIPMRFGMVVDEEGELQRVLERVYLQFILSLEKIRGKAEFSLHVLWDEKALLEDIRREVDVGGTVSEGTNVRTSLELGRRVFELLEDRRSRYLSSIQEELATFVPVTSTGKLIDENMILNLSLLIKKDDEPQLDACLQRLGQKYGHLQFSYWGPLPAYSFVDINLSLGDFELIERARKTLGLPEEATLFDIKQLYRRLALERHPDRGGSEEAMKRLTRAYEILENYCRHYVYSFTEGNVRKVVITKPEKISHTSPT